jgi:hypothetical protein
MGLEEGHVDEIIAFHEDSGERAWERHLRGHFFGGMVRLGVAYVALEADVLVDAALNERILRHVSVVQAPRDVVYADIRARDAEREEGANDGIDGFDDGIDAFLESGAPGVVVEVHLNGEFFSFGVGW